MKLSEKGAKKVFEHAMWGDGYYDLEDVISVNLEPDDFTNCVVLTLDEAKALLRRIPEFKENGDWQLPIERLKERIKQSEGK